MSSAPPASAGSARPAGSGSGGAAASSGAQQHRRNSQRGGRNRSAASASTPHTAGLKPTMTRFVGKEEGLGAAFVSQAMVGNDASDQYAKTTEEIIRYATTKFTHGCDVEQSLTDGVLLDLPLPVAPTAIAPAVVPFDHGLCLLMQTPTRAYGIAENGECSNWNTMDQPSLAGNSTHYPGTISTY